MLALVSIELRRQRLISAMMPVHASTSKAPNATNEFGGPKGIFDFETQAQAGTCMFGIFNFSRKEHYPHEKKKTKQIKQDRIIEDHL